MIPFLRSLDELMVITQSRDKNKIHSGTSKNTSISNSSIKKEKKSNPSNKKIIDLPNLPNRKRRKWIRSKEAVLRFFDELDYNNQIQSSYEITLLDRQINYDQKDIA